MIKKIKEKLTEGFDTEKNPFLYRRLIMTSALLIIALVAFTAFIFINSSLKNYTLVKLDAFLVLLSSLSLYYLFVKKRIEFAALVATTMLFAFLILFSFITKNHGFGLVWTLCYPLFVIPILGTRKGLLMILLFYLILVPIVYSGIGDWDNGFWSKTAFLRFFMVSLTVVFIAYFFESSSVAAYKTVMAIREKEQSYLRELENLSVTDQLTGLNNRRYFDKQFQLEFAKVQRYGSKLSLIMLDIDHFKNINDQHGHQIGDEALKEFSNLLKNKIRATDILSRWGGEEFIILLPETSISNAAIIAEKLRVSIAKRDFKIVGRLTASLGVSQVFSKEGGNREAILNADNALYDAKRQGRNKVVITETVSAAKRIRAQV